MRSDDDGDQESILEKILREEDLGWRLWRSDGKNETERRKLGSIAMNEPARDTCYLELYLY